MNSDIDFRKVNPNIKSLYAFLKKYDIEEFFLTKHFEIALMELNLDEHWEKIRRFVIRESGVTVFISGFTGYVDEAFKFLLNLIYLKAKPVFIGILNHIIKTFISNKNVDDFDYNELKQRLLDCGFDSEEIRQMEGLGREIDISEIISQIPSPQVLPDGIDIRKYDEIFNQITLPSAMFQYIFVCENIMRKFIVQALGDNGYSSIDSIGNQKLSKAIQDKKNKEARQKYLPLRGDHDIYYLDLIELIGVIRHVWKDCFEEKFKDQQWIFARIDSLYSIRNRVAHSSSLTSDEFKSVETYCREIIKQIDQYIK